MKRFFRFFAKLVFWGIVFSVSIVVLFKYVPVPLTPLMGIRYFEGTNKAWKHEWVAIDNISKNMQLAVICSEDQKFLEHHGFDIKAIEKAYENNKKENALKAPVPLASKPLKMCFYGLSAVGYVKA